MQKLLINTHGETFATKEQNNFSNYENKFIWKQNINKLAKIKISQLKATFSQNKYSKKGKQTFTLYKQIDHKYNRYAFKKITILEKQMIQRGLLHFGANQNEIKFIFANQSLALNYYNLKAIIKQQADANKNFRTKIFEVYAPRPLLKFNSFKKEISKFFQNYTHQKASIKKFQKLAFLKLDKAAQTLDAIISDVKRISYAKQSNKFQPVAKTKRHINKSFFSKLLQNFKMLQEAEKNEALTNLKMIDKIKFFSLFNHLKVIKNKIALDHISGLEKTAYDYELMQKNATTRIFYETKIIALKKKNAIEVNQMRRQIQAANRLNNKAFQNEWQLQKQMLKFHYQKQLSAIKLGKGSKRAKLIEYQKWRMKLTVLKRNLILKHSAKARLQKDLELKINHFQNQKSKLIKLRNNEVNSNLRSVPLELRTWKYYTSIVLEIIFPGLGSLFSKKYLKALFLIPTTTIMIFICAWIFGAFPSSNGNGIIGLIDLGHDPQTASGINIGLTNGIPHDARFFLVMGVVGIILLAFAIMYWIITILANINANNLAKLGIRYNNWRETKKLLKTQGLPYFLSIPAIIFITFLVILPVLATVFISFTNFNERLWDPSLKRHYLANGWSKPFKWVGLDQYDKVFNSMGQEFKSVFLWTILWTFGASMLTIFIGTLMAILVNQKRIRFKTLFGVIYILPWAVPAFITIMFFSLFFAHDGIFNQVIGNKLFAPGTDWKDAHNQTKMLIIIIQGWLGHSYMFLLITGMLQAIPKSLYEASRIDGASNMFQFRTITVPIIVSKILPLLIGQFTFNFSNFSLIYLFNEGGNPVDAGGVAGEYDILISWVYKLVNGGIKNSPGAAAAISLLISIFTIAPSALIFLRSKTFRKGEF